MGHRHVEQAVPRGVVLDFIYPVPVCVVGPQAGREAVGFEPPTEDLGGPGERPELGQFGVGRAGAGSLQGTGKEWIGGEEVVVHQGRRLVQDLVRRRHQD